MNLAEYRRRLVADLRLIEDPHERLSAVVDRGRAQPALAVTDRVGINKVPGCVSDVFLVRESKDGRCSFRIDSGSALIKGMAGLLCELYLNRTPDEIMADPDGLIEDIGLGRLVTPNRLQGIGRVRESMHAFAAKMIEGLDP